MPRKPPSLQRLASTGLARSTALAAVLLAYALTPALAQNSGLRGEVSEAEVNQELMWRRLADRPSRLSPQAQSQQQYQPFSAGAVPDDATRTEQTDTLFPDPSSDTFGERPAARIDASPDRPAGEETADQDRTTATEDAEATDETATGTVRQETVDSADEERNTRTQSENGRDQGIENLDNEPETDPYAPVGIRAGTFIVTPTLEQGVVWTDNAFYSPTPEESFLSETTLRLNAASDWARHSASINAYGTYRKSLAGADVVEPSAGIDAALNLDFREDLRGVFTAGYALRPETADSPVVLPPVVSRPLLHTLTGSAGLEKDVGKLRFGLTGRVERLGYSDADLAGGGVLSQRERNSTLVAGALRVGYQISPALTPFIEAEYGRRIYELRVDSAGYARSSNRTGLRAGVELDLGEKLTGEVSAGWINERFDDSRLKPISGPALAASLAWSPQRGTTVNLNAETMVEGTTTAGDSGSIYYSATLAASRQIRSNLTLDASVGAALRDYANSSNRDLTLRGETSLTWWMNRAVGLVGRYRIENLDSTLPGRDATTNQVYLGVKLQR